MTDLVFVDGFDFFPLLGDFFEVGFGESIDYMAGAVFTDDLAGVAYVIITDDGYAHGHEFALLCGAGCFFGIGGQDEEYGDGHEAHEGRDFAAFGGDLNNKRLGDTQVDGSLLEGG